MRGRTCSRLAQVAEPSLGRSWGEEFLASSRDEDVLWQSTFHEEQGQLSQTESCIGRESTRAQENELLWSLSMELEKCLCIYCFNISGQGVRFCLGWRGPRHQHHRVRKTFSPSSEPYFDSEPSSHIFSQSMAISTLNCLIYPTICQLY